jgi:hypothetical protein
MQDDVGEERADPRALRRTLGRLVFSPLSRIPTSSHSGRAGGSKVRILCDNIPIATRGQPSQRSCGFGIEHPVQSWLMIAARDEESLVLVTPRPQAVGEPEEFGFVDGAQRLGHRVLDKRVLQSCTPSGLWPPSAFGMWTRRTGRGQYRPVWTRRADPGGCPRDSVRNSPP